MSDCGSDGYEYENDGEYEVFEEERLAKGRFRAMIKKQYDELIESMDKKEEKKKNKKSKQQEDEDKILIYIHTDKDTDRGILEGVGGYYEVREIAPDMVRPRRHIINTLTVGYIVSYYNKLTVDSHDISDKEFSQIDRLSDQELELHEGLAITEKVSLFNDNWKDFKYFLTMKYFNLPDEEIIKLANLGIKDIYTKNYTEFLLSKARFLYKDYYGCEDLSRFAAMRDCFKERTFEQKTKDSRDLKGYVYNSTFYSELNRALKLHEELHQSAFANFTSLSTLNCQTESWLEEDNYTYKDFLGRSTSVSYLELDNGYNLKYLSKTRTNENESPNFIKDVVLEKLKVLFRSLALDISLVCKAFKRISLIKRNLSCDDSVENILNFIEVSGCNYVTFYNGMSFEFIVQTTLSNVFQFSTPICIFPIKYTINKDVAFINISKIKGPYYPVNDCFRNIKAFNDQRFGDNRSVDDYSVYLLNYYSRLSNIPDRDLDKWCKKTTSIKSKIYASSQYIRNIAASKIQSFYKLFVKGFNHKKEREFKEQQLLKQAQLDLYEDDKLIDHFVKQVQQEKSYLEKQSESEKFVSSYEEECMTIPKVSRILDTSKLAYKLTTYGSVVLPNRFNSESKWFGFNRNKQLVALIMSIGEKIDILDIKCEYTKLEFERILEAVGRISSITRSNQFTKLCRIMSGTVHKSETIEDFISGFCWIYKKVTVENVLKMANYFCSSTRNYKWFTYLADHTDEIFKIVTATINY
jgi:hypothetical protein